MFTFINGLVGAMKLDQVLVVAEEVFSEYCRKSVERPKQEEESPGGQV